MLPNRTFVLPWTVAAITTAITSAMAGEGLSHETGTRHRLAVPASTPFLPVGCLDHRTLMFVVNEIEGEEPEAAKLLAGRDCRPLVPDQVYIRCGPGGWAYSTKGERLSFASYCRAGVKDLPLYVLDIQMKKIEEGASPPR